jgi:hypothetical protein
VFCFGCRLFTRESTPKYDARLYLVLGAPYILTQNVFVPSALANGTQCTLMDIVVEQKDVTFRRGSPRVGGGVHVVSVSNVLGLVLRHSGAYRPAATNQFGLGEYCFPLISVLHGAGVCVVAGHRHRLYIKQFAVLPAWSYTGHKIQGSTLKSMAVGSWKGKSTDGMAGCMSFSAECVVLLICTYWRRCSRAEASTSARTLTRRWSGWLTMYLARL